MLSQNSDSAPYPNYSSILELYSKDNQLKAKQYQVISQSSIGDEVNANTPEYAKRELQDDDGKATEGFMKFLNFRQYAGSMHTDWRSSGIQNQLEDMSIRNMKLDGIENPTLVLSNSNNVRKVLQNYGAEYLRTTELLNREGFYNGAAYTASTSPYREDTREGKLIEYNSQNGDIATFEYKLRPDLPIGYSNPPTRTFQYPLGAFIQPYYKPGVRQHFTLQNLKYGTFYLTSIKYIGESCLTKEFNSLPHGYTSPTDIFTNQQHMTPVTNPEYFTEKSPYYLQKQGETSNLYCSPNSNYVTMPLNPMYKTLDTSFNNGIGDNSIKMGEVISPELKLLITTTLFKINKLQILRHLLEQAVNAQKIPTTTPDTDVTNWSLTINNIKRLIHSLNENNYPFTQTLKDSLKYITLSKENKWYMLQTVKDTMHENASIGTQGFLQNLIISYFGGTIVDPGDGKEVRCAHAIVDPSILKVCPKEFLPNCMSKMDCTTELQKSMVRIEDEIPLLLPSMLSEDLFVLRNKIPENMAGTIADINKRFTAPADDPIASWPGPVRDYPGDCPRTTNPRTEHIYDCYCGSATVGQTPPLTNSVVPWTFPQGSNNPNAALDNSTLTCNTAFGAPIHF